MHTRSWVVTTTAATASASVIALALGGVAMASPAPPPATYAAGASATMFTGLAFDTCTAPPLSSMAAWQASPYHALGVYIGGIDRHCPQPQLTAPWVTAVAVQGWRLIPIYKGLQAPCS